MFHSANGSDSSHSMRLLEVCRVYDMGMGVSNRRCAAEAACTISADANQWFTLNSFLVWGADKPRRCSLESHRDAQLLDAIRTIPAHLT